MYKKSKGNASNKGQGNKSYKGRNQSNYRSRESDSKEKFQDKGTCVNTYGKNEPSWYNRESRLIADATKISMANQLGRVVKMGGSNIADSANSVPADFVVPGVMAFKMVNTPGIARDANDGVNLAAAMLFQKIRKNISTVANYSSADVMLYALGIDNIYSQYANLTRCFGMLNAYSAFNLYAPRSVIRAAYGFSDAEIDKIMANINDYRARFNNLIFKASTLYLPTDFSIVQRHAWLYSNYFMDTIGTKSQIYVHRMMGIHKLNETFSKQGTALEYIESATTLSELLDQFATCIEVYRSSDSMMRIAADMRRAFETSNAWSLAYVDETYIIVPMPVDQHIRSQLHNMDIYPTPAYNKIKQYAVTPNDSTAGTFHIGQDVNSNIIVFNPILRTSDTEWHNDGAQLFAPTWCNKLLDFHGTEVTSDDILEATRNTWRTTVAKSGSDYSITIEACGADLCVGVDICSLNPVSGVLDYVSLESNLSWPSAVPTTLVKLEAFDGAPYIWYQQDTGAVPFCEFDNYTVVDKNVITTINNVVMTSMWSVPADLGLVK